MAYPNTDFLNGEIDAAHGGKPANVFGTPQHIFQDSQIRELQRQAVDQWWSGRPLQHLPIASGGIAGDTIVFDEDATNSGDPKYVTIPTTSSRKFVGWLVEAVSAGQAGRVFLGGGFLTTEVTGLSGADFGDITVDGATGRLRAQTGSEPIFGFLDKKGNCHLNPISSVLSSVGSTGLITLQRTIVQPADGSDFRVTFMIPLLNTNYIPLCPYVVTGTSSVNFVIPEGTGDRLTTSFRCITSAPLDDGDVVQFIVDPGPV